LILGSGGLSIGQAGEFDYSGTQAVKACIEEKCQVVVVNPNIATVQTNPSKQVRVYLYPVNADWVEKIIQKENPDAIMASFGGQTALNCLLDLERKGILQRYGVEILGTPAKTLELTEDRDLFAKAMDVLGLPTPPSCACSNVEEALEATRKIGYPVIVRAAYALGGLGSGFAYSDEDIRSLVVAALAACPQVLVEKSLKGWREIEYEVMRDHCSNAMTVCNIENFDPLGIHTGDSIAVAPSQSLTDAEFQKLRDASIRIIEYFGVIGEANVQFALDQNSNNFYVIEANARLSRSSALASKVTGYPIAYIAAKVILGKSLLSLKNPVTQVTTAFFEPALDYVAVKIPRWDLHKFVGVSKKLGSTMKSVGEVMAIGRNFPEALQKAVRMVTEHPLGLWKQRSSQESTGENLQRRLHVPTDKRLYDILTAFRQKVDLDTVYKETGIDKWFLYQLEIIVETEEAILAEAGSSCSDTDLWLRNISEESWRLWKGHGFSDVQIAAMCLEKWNISSVNIDDFSFKVRKARLDVGVFPVVKRIDTTAGEFPAVTNYFYMTYNARYHDISDHVGKPKAIVLGGGAYRIGSSVEFDWCGVSSSETLRDSGWQSIIINCNPETVSTDYNASDTLYFEELTLERILDIIDVEKPDGVIVSMGGQVPNQLAAGLASSGVKILGHQAETIDRVEDRAKFSALLDQLKIDQPCWVEACDKSQIEKLIKSVGFPVLVRPSYVLSGAAMKVAFDESSLQEYLSDAAEISPEYPVVISEFILDAREIELDGVACYGEVIAAIIGEHVENAGVHSGDATMVVPAQNLYVETVRKVRHAGRKIVEALGLHGPFNIQFLARHNHIQVIECNVRASRSFPFVSKVTGMPLATLATQVAIGVKTNFIRRQEDELSYVGVKAAMFSFARLSGADPVLGVEMASTGEVGCIASDFEQSLLLALESTYTSKPKKGILVSAGPEVSKVKFLSTAKLIQEHLNIPLYATNGTAKFLLDHDVKVQKTPWPCEGPGDVLEVIRSGDVDLVINIPKNFAKREVCYGSLIRKTASQFHCPLITNLEKSIAFIRALVEYPNFLSQHEVQALPYFPQ